MNVNNFMTSLSDWLNNKKSNIENICFVVQESDGNYKKYSEIENIFIEKGVSEKTLLIELKK